MCMNRLRWVVMMMGVCGALLAACAPAPTDEVRGRLLFWHTREADAAALADIVAAFEDIYPGVEVVIEVVPEGDLRQRYENTVALGLGPDMVIAPTRWIPALTSEGLIQNIEPDNPPLEHFLTAAVENVRYDGNLYGLPFSLEPAALYYNVERVATPPQTLDDMLAQGADNTTFGILTRFDGGFWGVAALGGQLFGPDGRVVLNQGAFASWLSWLQNAQDAPGLTLSRDPVALRELFIAGELDAYVGKPDDLPLVREALGTTGFAVAPLPGGQGNPAGPLLDVDAMLFNPATSNATRQAALELARFLTNDEQSRVLIRTRNIVPANRRVQPNARLYPGISGFVTQARTAVAVPNTVAMSAVLAQGDALLQQVLAGVITGPEAAETLTASVNELAGFAPVATTVERCELDGTLELWHSWSGDDEAALEAIIDAYTERCPDVSFDLISLPSADTIVSGFQAVAGTRAVPDAVLIPSERIFTLASNDLLQAVPLENTEQYTPATLESVRYRNALYGLPVSLHTSVLYYNTTMVSDPAVTLDDLFTAARAGTGVALPRTFEGAYWGAPAYGAALFGEDGRLLLDQGGFAGWLGWMAEMDTLPSVTLDSDRVNRNTFTNGEAAYYVGPSTALPELREALGEAAVGTMTLPSGPAAPAAPLLTTSAFVLSAGENEITSEIALDFGRYLTNVGCQRMLAEDTLRVPVNVNVSLTEDRNLETFRQQALQVTILPRIPERTALLARGNNVYRDVLNNGIAPEQAVADFVAAVNEANGFEPTAVPLTPTTTDDAEATPDTTITPTVTSEGE